MEAHKASTIMTRADTALLKKFGPRDLSVEQLSLLMDEAALEVMSNCIPGSEQGLLSDVGLHEIAAVSAFQRNLARKVHARLWPNSKVMICYFQKGWIV